MRRAIVSPVVLFVLGIISGALEDNEEYIVKLLYREKRIGTVEKLAELIKTMKAGIAEMKKAANA